jgi:antitoxin VapB
MALNIRNSATERLAAELARLTGEKKTEAVRRALEERLERLRKGKRPRSREDDLNEIAERCASLPERDRREPDEIIGYDENGVPR